jgi:hypothetical protein
MNKKLTEKSLIKKYNFFPSAANCLAFVYLNNLTISHKIVCQQNVRPNYIDVHMTSQETTTPIILYFGKKQS